MNIDLTLIVQAVITLLAAFVTYKIIPWIKSKTTNEQQKALMATVNVLVYAAEQVYGSGHGDEKLQYVKERLKARGYNIDIEAIEAAVKEMNIQQAFAADGGVLIPAFVEDDDGEDEESSGEDEDEETQH